MNSLAELPSELKCHHELHRILWGTINCPDCNHRLLYRKNYEYCPCCHKKTSVRSESAFRNSKLTFRQIWSMIWLWQHGSSIGEIKRQLNLSYLTIRRWIRKLRQLLPEDSTTQLYSEVEVDESYFGKLKFGRQRLVIGAIERSTGHIKLKIIKDRTRETVEDFIEDSIAPGSLIATDSLASYDELHLLGYEHEDCNHEAGIFGPTNRIEGLWSVLKRHIRRVHNNLSFSYNDFYYLLREHQLRHNQPELFYNVTNYIFACCSV